MLGHLPTHIRVPPFLAGFLGAFTKLKPAKDFTLFLLWNKSHFFHKTFDSVLETVKKIFLDFFISICPTIPVTATQTSLLALPKHLDLLQTHTYTKKGTVKIYVDTDLYHRDIHLLRIVTIDVHSDMRSSSYLRNIRRTKNGCVVHASLNTFVMTNEHA